MTTQRELVERLRPAGQEHLLAHWARLDEPGRRSLADQIQRLDFVQVAAMRTMLPGPGSRTAAAVTAAEAMRPAPVVAPDPAARAHARETGEAALRAGRVGVILVAGGQGTRLGYDGPKGTFPLAPITAASLFAIHCRKILAVERRYGAAVPFYIMTSEANDAETRRVFAAEAYYGLAPERVRLFCQGTCPALWPDGRIVLEAPSRIATAPDGHGGVLAALEASGALADMARRGLETLFYFQVDNPLVEIADPVFVGLHTERGADMSLKVCAKRDANEGLGVVVERGGTLAVVEYTELTAAQKHARGADGRLLYRYGSVAIHAFSRPFLAREAGAGLPLHLAHKKVPHCDEAGRTVNPEHPNAFKFEKFIFDALPDARNAVVTAFAREDEFAPVKNAAGADSPETARQAMAAKYARWLDRAGVRVPRDAHGRPAVRLEIDPCYALDADELERRLPRDFAVRGDVLLVEPPAGSLRRAGV